MTLDPKHTIDGKTPKMEIILGRLAFYEKKFPARFNLACELVARELGRPVEEVKECARMLAKRDAHIHAPNG